MRDARSCQVTGIMFPTFSAGDDDSLAELCVEKDKARKRRSREAGRRRPQVEAGGPINKFAVPTSGNLSACLISPV